MKIKDNLNILDLVCLQLKSNFSLKKVEIEVIQRNTKVALKYCEGCFAGINSKYYFDENSDIIFNPFHSGQYTTFLYFLSRAIYLTCPEQRNLLDKIYYLNRMLNSVDLFYEVELPVVFFVDHPLGSVIGRGKFGKNFSFQQNCTIGNNKGIYPTLSENIIMLTGVSIIGDCNIGDNVLFGAHSFIKDTDIPAKSLVVGKFPNFKVLPLSEDLFRTYFSRFKL